MDVSSENSHFTFGKEAARVVYESSQIQIETHLSHFRPFFITKDASLRQENEKAMGRIELLQTELERCRLEIENRKRADGLNEELERARIISENEIRAKSKAIEQLRQENDQLNFLLKEQAQKIGFLQSRLSQNALGEEQFMELNNLKVHFESLSIKLHKELSQSVEEKLRLIKEVEAKEKLFELSESSKNQAFEALKKRDEELAVLRGNMEQLRINGESFKREIEGLRRNLDASENACKRAFEEIEKTKINAERSIQTIQMQNGELRTRIINLEEALEMATEKLRLTEERLKTAESSAGLLMTRFEEINSKYSESSRKLEEQASELRAAIEQINILEKEKSKMKSEKKQMDRTAEILMLQDELRVLKEIQPKYDYVQKENKRLLEEVTKTKEELAECKRHLGQLKKEIQNQDVQNRELRVNVGVLEGSLLEARKELENLNRQLVDKEKTKAMIGPLTKELENSVAQAEGLKIDLMKAMDNEKQAKEDAEYLSMALKELERQSNKTEGELQNKIREMQLESKGQMAEKERFKKAIHQKIEELEKWHQKAMEAGDRAERTAARNAQLEETLAERTRTIEELRNRLKNQILIENDLEDERATRTKLETLSECLREQVEATQQQLLQAIEEGKEWKERYAQAEKQCKEFGDSSLANLNLRKEAEEREEELKRLKLEKDGFIGKMMSHQEEKAQWEIERHQLKETIKHLKEAAMSRCSVLEDEIRRMNMTEGNQRMNMARGEQVLHNLQNQLEETKKQLRKRERTLQEMEKEMVILHENMNKMSQKEKESEIEARRLMGIIQSERKESKEREEELVSELKREENIKMKKELENMERDLGIMAERLKNQMVLNEELKRELEKRETSTKNAVQNEQNKASFIEGEFRKLVLESKEKDSSVKELLRELETKDKALGRMDHLESGLLKFQVEVKRLQEFIEKQQLERIQMEENYAVLSQNFKKEQETKRKMEEELGLTIFECGKLSEMLFERKREVEELRKVLQAIQKKLSEEEKERKRLLGENKKIMDILGEKNAENEKKLAMISKLQMQLEAMSYEIEKQKRN